MVITGEKTNNMFSRMVQRGVTPGHAGHGGPPENCINLRTAGDPMTYFSVGETPTRPSRHGIQNKSRESTAGSRVRASACWSLRSSRAQVTGGACAPGWRPLASHVGWPVVAARADPVGWRRWRRRWRRRRRSCILVAVLGPCVTQRDCVTHKDCVTETVSHGDCVRCHTTDLEAQQAVHGLPQLIYVLLEHLLQPLVYQCRVGVGPTALRRGVNRQVS